MNHRPVFIAIISLLILIFTNAKSSNPNEAEKIALGDSLFNKHCTFCHTLGQINTGPQLAGITKVRDEQWLHLFISDASVLIELQDSLAIAVSKKYYMIRHTKYNKSLSDEEITSIIKFLSRN